MQVRTKYFFLFFLLDDNVCQFRETSSSILNVCRRWGSLDKLCTLAFVAEINFDYYRLEWRDDGDGGG